MNNRPKSTLFALRAPALGLLSLAVFACAGAKAKPGGDERKIVAKAGPTPMWTRKPPTAQDAYFVGMSDEVAYEARGTHGALKPAVEQAARQAVDAIVAHLGLEIKSTFESRESSDGSQSVNIQMRTEGNHTLKLDARSFTVYWEVFEFDGDVYQKVWVKIPFSLADYERTMSGYVDIATEEAQAHMNQAVVAALRGDFFAELDHYRGALERGQVLAKFKTLSPSITKKLREIVDASRRTLRDKLSSLYVERVGDGFAVLPGGAPAQAPAIVVKYRDNIRNLQPASGLPFTVVPGSPDLKVEEDGAIGLDGRGEIRIKSAPRRKGPIDLKVLVAKDLFAATGQNEPLTVQLRGEVGSATRALKVAVVIDDSAVAGGVPAKNKEELESFLSRLVQSAGFAKIDRGTRTGLLGNESPAELRAKGYGVLVRVAIEARVDTALSENLHTFEGVLGMQIVSLADGRELGRIDQSGGSCSTDVQGSGGNREYAVQQALAITGCESDLRRMFTAAVAGLE